MKEQGSVTQRRLASHSALIFGIRAFPAAAQIAVGIVFTRMLKPDLNGIYQQLWMYIAILIAIACFGIPPLLLTHRSKSVNHWLLSLRPRNSVVFIAWQTFIALILILLYHSKAAISPWILLCLFLSQAWILLLESYLIIHQKYVVPLILSLGYALAFVGVHWAFLHKLVSYENLLWSVALISLFRFVMLAVYARVRYGQETEAIRRRRIPLGVRSQWLQLGIYDISQVAFRWVDKMIISRIAGAALFSVYFVGTTDVPFMAMMLSAAGNSLLQQMAHGNSDHPSRIRLVNMSGILLARIVFPVFFFLFFFRTEIIDTIFTMKYSSAVPLFGISVLAIPLRAYNYTSVLQHLNKVKIINWGAVLDLSIACGLAIPLYYWKGLSGVAFAFMISSYIQALFYLVNTARFLHCSVLDLLPWKHWLIMFIVFGTLGIGFHEILIRNFDMKQCLMLGVAGTLIVIAAALAPVIFSKKTHGKENIPPFTPND